MSPDHCMFIAGEIACSQLDDQMVLPTVGQCPDGWTGVDAAQQRHWDLFTHTH